MDDNLQTVGFETEQKFSLKDNFPGESKYQLHNQKTIIVLGDHLVKVTQKLMMVV